MEAPPAHRRGDAPREAPVCEPERRAESTFRPGRVLRQDSRNSSCSEAATVYSFSFTRSPLGSARSEAGMTLAHPACASSCASCPESDEEGEERRHSSPLQDPENFNGCFSLSITPHLSPAQRCAHGSSSMEDMIQQTWAFDQGGHGATNKESKGCSVALDQVREWVTERREPGPAHQAAVTCSIDSDLDGRGGAGKEFWSWADVDWEECKHKSWVEVDKVRAVQAPRPFRIADSERRDSMEEMFSAAMLGEGDDFKRASCTSFKKTRSGAAVRSPPRKWEPHSSDISDDGELPPKRLPPSEITPLLDHVLFAMNDCVWLLLSVLLIAMAGAAPGEAGWPLVVVSGGAVSLVSELGKNLSATLMPALI